MTSLLELRTEAMHCFNVKRKAALKQCASDLDLAMRVFQEMPCDETLRAVNCYWSHGNRLLLPQPGDGGGGHMPVPQLAEAT